MILRGGQVASEMDDSRPALPRSAESPAAWQRGAGLARSVCAGPGQAPLLAASPRVRTPDTLPLDRRADWRPGPQGLPEAKPKADAGPERRNRAQSQLRRALQLVGHGDMRGAGDALEKCLENEPLMIGAHLLKASVREAADPGLAEALSAVVDRVR